MDKQNAVQSLTDTMAKFTAYIGKHLPTDVEKKLAELRGRETKPLAKAIYLSMAENQEAANRLDRPSCQDTGVIQYFITAGAGFPLLGELGDVLAEAVRRATRDAPLRHNAVETFVEKNTGTNTGSKIPWLDWDIVPGDDSVTIDVYMAGGGCTLPGKATVLMPGQGYEGVAEFVFDVITSRGVNACPPLLVGVGVSTSAETAARLTDSGVCGIAAVGAVREALLRLKFRGGSALAEPFGELLARCAAERFGGEFDTVTWVPVSQKRLETRGYDQSRLLAEAVCRHWDTRPVQLLVKVQVL